MSEAESSPEPDPLPPAPRQFQHAFTPKRLYRDPNGKIGGVASGLAAYFDIDPVITRLSFVVALLSGVGLFAYLACWVVIPKATSWPPPGHAEPSPGDVEQRAGSSVTSGVLVVALAALIGIGLDGVGDFLLPAALLGFGVYLLNQRPDDAPRNARIESSVQTGVDPQNPQPTRSDLVTPTVLSVLALGLGLALALQAAGVVSLSVIVLSSVGLLVVALGLVASLWLGRAKGLIPIGLVMGVVLVAASVVTPWINHASKGALDGLRADGKADDSFGKIVHKPRVVEELRPTYSLGVGVLTLDLRHLNLQGYTREVNAGVGAGKFKVILPNDVSVVVNGQVGAGKITGVGESQKDGKDGSRVKLERLLDGPGKLTVNFKVGLGQGRVVYGK